MAMMLMNLTWGCVIFIVLIIISFGSYCLLKRSIRSESRNVKTGYIISLSNCFACGVFLSACFLGLLPHVRKHEQQLRNIWITGTDQSHRLSHIFLNSDLIILIGFLLILLIEEVVHTLHQSGPHRLTEHCARTPQKPANGKNSKKTPNMPADGTESSVPNNSLPTLLSWDEDTEPLVSDNVSMDDFAEETVNFPTIEFRRINDEIIQRNSHNGHSHFALLSSSNISLSTVILMLGLSSHSIFEGIALGIQRTSAEFYNLLTAIMLHEVLCSFAFGVSLAQQKTSPKTAFISATILAISIPMGMSSSLLISSIETSNALLSRFLLEGMAAGTFIYVACIEMLSAELKPNEPSARSGIPKVVAIIVGVFIFFVVTNTFGHHSAMKSMKTTPSMGNDS